MTELLPIEHSLYTLLDALTVQDDLDDDLDLDDEVELVIELCVTGVVEWLDTPRRHPDTSWGDLDDPYWELGDGD